MDDEKMNGAMPQNEEGTQQESASVEGVQQEPVNNENPQQEQAEVVPTVGEGADIPTAEGSMNVFTPESEAPEPVPEQPKKSRAPIVIGVVAVIAVAAAAAAYITLNSPQKVVERAMVNTGAVLAERNSVFKYFGGEEIETLVKEGAYSIDQSFGITNIPGSEEINGLGFSIDADQDMNAKLAAMEVGVDYNGVSLDALQAYTDDENIIFGSPMLYDGLFEISTDNILSQVENSPVFSSYADQLGIDENFSLRVFDDIQESEEASAQLTAEYALNWTELYQSMTFDKTDAKDVNGVNCKGYTVFIPSAAAETYFDGMIDDTFNNEYVKDQLEKSAELYYISYGYTSAEEYVDDIYSQIDTLKEDLLIGDITADIYVSDGIIVDSSTTVDLTNGDSDTVTLTLTGGYAQGEGLKLALDTTYAGETFTVEYSDSVSEEENSLAETYNIDFVSGTEELGLAFNSDYDTAGGGLTADISITENDAKMGAVNMSGSLVNSGGNFELDLTDISVVGSDEQAIAEFTYALSFAPLDGGIEKPEGEPVRILEISQDEWDTIYSQIQGGLIGLIMQFQ